MAPTGAMLPGESAKDAPPAWAVGDETQEAIILEEALLDEEMKARVMQRVEIVARVGGGRSAPPVCSVLEAAKGGRVSRGPYQLILILTFAQSNVCQSPHITFHRIQLFHP